MPGFGRQVSLCELQELNPGLMVLCSAQCAQHLMTVSAVLIISLYSYNLCL